MTHIATEWRPLVVAAAEGFPDIATLLLDARAYVNQGTKEGWTPLLAASRQFQWQTVV